MMIQSESKLPISDNSGGKNAKCIKLLGGFKKKEITIGNPLILSLQKIKTNERKKVKLKAGEIVKGLLIRSKKKFDRSNFSSFQSKESACVLLSKTNKVLATRVIGSVPKEIRFTKFMKVALLSSALY